MLLPRRLHHRYTMHRVIPYHLLACSVRTPSLADGNHHRSVRGPTHDSADHNVPRQSGAVLVRGVPAGEAPSPLLMMLISLALGDRVARSSAMPIPATDTDGH